MAASTLARGRKPWAPVKRLGYEPEGPWLRERQPAHGENSVLGISVLSALSVAGIWSSINPSYFALRSFANQPETRHIAREGLWIGLAASTAASVGILLVFDRWVPALVAELTALALFGVSLYAVNSPPIETSPRA